MPRGPGKKDNYNLNYSRFNGVDGDIDERPHATKGEDDAVAEPASNMPPMEDILRNMPPELREAYRLLAVSRETGDPAAQRRVNELALMAVKKGSPEIQRAFINQVAKTDTEAADILEQELGGTAVPESSQDITRRIDRLRKEMEAGASATRKQLEALQAQQEQLAHLQSPEDVLRFMHQEGLTAEDMQRIFSGDTEHMERCIGGVLERQIGQTAGPRIDPDQAVKAAEQLHATVCGSGVPEALVPEVPPSTPSSEPVAKPAKPAPRDEVTIPDYRLQYHKDDAGRYCRVELTCSLPGVAVMSAIALDVSEKHLRLQTLAPAPRFAVNAGPFPVLIDPSQAKAKFTRRRQELSVTVPAKVGR